MIRSDNGTEFNGLAAASQQMGFEWRRSSKNNPQSNGMVERLQTKHEMELERALERGTFLYNIKTHSATGYKPFKLLYGRDPEDLREVLDQKRFGRINTNSEIARFVAARAQNLCGRGSTRPKRAERSSYRATHRALQGRRSKCSQGGGGGI